MDADAWRRVSDVAQVVASYLVCRDDVLAVRYPGLTADPDYREASSTLRGGFGPLVDTLLADGTWARYDARAATGDAREEVLRLER